MGAFTLAVAVTGEPAIKLNVAPGVKMQVAPAIRGVKLQLRATLSLNVPCAVIVKLTGGEVAPTGSVTSFGEAGVMLQFTT